MTKKFIGIMVILTMLLSISPCASFATLTAQDIADNINLDMMTSQSSYAITKALDFSSVIRDAESSGATVKFTSSDESVFFISGNTGKITRDADETKTVTLTVTVLKDSVSATKNLIFTVPAQSIFVYESEGFGRENCVDQGIQSLGTRWDDSSLTETATNGLLGKIEKGTDGYSFNLTKNEYSKTSTPYAIYSFDDMPKTGVVTFSYSVTLGDYEIDAETANYDGIYFDAELYAKDENGNSLAVTSGNKKYIGKTRLNVYKENSAQSAKLEFSVRTDDAGTTPTTYKTKAVDFGTKTRITHEIDFENKTYKLYIGDSISVSKSFLENSLTTAASLDYFQFNIQRQGISASIEFDDFVVTSNRSSLEGNDLTISDAKGSLSLKVTGNNKKIAITSKYDKENMLTQVLGVRSNTNEHIEFYDVYMTDKTGNKTDLLERTIADESSPIMFQGALVGGNHGPSAPRIKVASHGKTIADVGTLWRDAAGGEWVLVSIYSADYIILFSTRIPTNWSFPSAVATKDSQGNTNCVLTRIEDGEETGETMTFTTQTSDQLFFLSKDNKQECTAYLADGTEEIIDLSVNRELTADKVQIVDTYTITDAKAFAEELIKNRPDGGYSEEKPPVYAGGEDVFYYKAVYTILDDGTVLTEFDHEYNANAQGVQYYGLQYYMKANLGGGVKRLIPGSSPFTAPSAVFTGRDSCSNGEEQVFDFSVPWQLYRFNTGLSYNTFELPGSSTWLAKGRGFETDYVPSRQIDFMFDENDVSDIAFASGFLPLYDAEPEVRKQYTDYAFSTKGTAKAYHSLATKNKGKQGDTIKAIGYRKYEDADRYGGKASVYSIPYVDMIYYYVDLLQDTSVDIYALGANEENLSVVENFGDAELTVHNGKITISGKQKDFVVLTVPREEFSISESSCNASTGKVSALIHNFSDDERPVKLICAGYEENKMTQIEFKNVNVAGGNSVVIFEEDFSSAEKIVVFMLNENGTLKPLCENVEQVGLGF